MAYNERDWYRQRDWMLSLSMGRVNLLYRKTVDRETGITKARELRLGGARILVEGSLKEFGRGIIGVLVGKMHISEAVGLALSLVVSQGGDDRDNLREFVCGMTEQVSAGGYSVDEVLGVVQSLREDDKIGDWEFARCLAGCGLEEERIAKEMSVYVNGRSEMMAREVVRSGGKVFV